MVFPAFSVRYLAKLVKKTLVHSRFGACGGVILPFGHDSAAGHFVPNCILLLRLLPQEYDFAVGLIEPYGLKRSAVRCAAYRPYPPQALPSG